MRKRSKKGDSLGIILFIIFALFIFTLAILLSNYSKAKIEKEEKLCKSKGMIYEEVNRLCISGDKAYQILWVKNKPRIIKQVVTLDNENNREAKANP